MAPAAGGVAAASPCGVTSQLVSTDELAVVGILGTLATSAPSTPAPEPPMTEAEAKRLAEAEGLQLVVSNNTVGFKGVSRNAAGW